MVDKVWKVSRKDQCCSRNIPYASCLVKLYLFKHLESNEIERQEACSTENMTWADSPSGRVIVAWEKEETMYQGNRWARYAKNIFHIVMKWERHESPPVIKQVELTNYWHWRIHRKFRCSFIRVSRYIFKYKTWKNCDKHLPKKRYLWFMDSLLFPWHVKMFSDRQAAVGSNIICIRPQRSDFNEYKICPFKRFNHNQYQYMDNITH